MGGKLGWFPFYPRDWYGDPKLACCHPTTRGMWMDLLALMFIEGQTSIHADRTALMRLCRCDIMAVEQFLSDIARYNFADVTECNAVLTITSRRFVRDEKTRVDTRERVRKFRSKTAPKNDVKRSSNGNVLYDSVSVSNSSSDQNKNQDRIQPADLVEAWNDHCAPVGLSKVEFLSSTRKQKASLRLREHPDSGFWEKVLGQIRGSAFLRGMAKPAKPDQKPFKATFDWLIDNDTNVVKVYEGKYADKEARAAG